MKSSPPTLAVLAVLLLAAPGRGQETPGEPPPYRLQIDRVAIEEDGEGRRLSLSASSDLPAGTVVSLSIRAVKARFDPHSGMIARVPEDPPAVYRLSFEAARRGTSALSTTCDIRREGELSLEVAFHPDRLFDAEREALEKAMGRRFAPLRWETSALVGTASSRLHAFEAGARPTLAEFVRAERMIRQLGRAPGTREAIVAAVARLEPLRLEIERTLPETPYPASSGRLWEILGEAAAWGAIRATKAASAPPPGEPASGGARSGGPDAATTPADPKESAADDSSEERLLGALERAREVLYREFALAMLVELEFLERDTRALVADDWPSEAKGLRFARTLENAHSALLRHRDFGTSRLGEPFERLLGEHQRGALEEAMDRVGRLAGLLAEPPAPAEARRSLLSDLEQGRSQITLLSSAWSRLDSGR